MSSISFQNSQNVNLRLQKANVTSRILAYLLDLVILLSAYLLPLSLFAYIEAKLAIQILSVLMGFVILVYQYLMEIFFDGQSLGKSALKIKVVSKDGTPLRVSQLTLRWLFRFVDIAISNGMVAILTIILGEKGQRVGDIVAGTMVISEKKKVRSSDLEIPTFPEDYVPVFSQAANLTEKHVKVIKNCLKLDLSYEHRMVIKKVETKMIEDLGLETELRDKKLLKQLLDDYYFHTISVQNQNHLI
ncbi:RDD family protein [Flammeovirga sp. MY04]|uniref:RDD family protein n=1 Tax=Flammeovirga sp. MY04 TaxID=1191459 RepID=UPI0008062830|nr:RDD family protein [Flammeovirga sp. MY04]ANQ51810.1 RDD family protein [Flammeovirga sp. MY04]